MADEDIILASVSTILAVAVAKKRRQRNRSCWVRAFMPRAGHSTVHAALLPEIRVNFSQT